MIRALALVVALSRGTHAAPAHDSPAVATAKQHLATAKAELKSAKASERAQKQAGKRTAKIAKLRAQITKLEHSNAQPSEETCRGLARKGETWEDACERVYKIDPRDWDPATGERIIGCGTCTDNRDGSCTCPDGAP